MGAVSELCEPDALLGRADELAGAIASAPRAATREVRRRVLLDAERSWLPLLDD